MAKPKDAESTPKVNRSFVLCNYQTKRLKRERNAETGVITAGTTGITVTGNAQLFYPVELIGFFNFPEYQGSTDSNGAVAIVNIDGYTYKTGGANPFADGASGRDIVNPGYSRLPSASKGMTRGRSVLVPTGFKSVKGKPKYVSVKFPSFFNLVMISQMLGSMIKSTTPKPGIFLTPEARAQYPIHYNSLTTPFPGSSSGAWVGTSFIAGTNLDNVDDISADTATSGTGGDPDGNATGG